MSGPASGLVLPNSQKLKGEENYTQWVRAIESIAYQFDLHKYYHPDAPAGLERINELQLNQMIPKEAKMRQAIEFNIHSGPMAVIATEKTAKGMWLKLKLQYEGSGAVLEHSAIQDYVRQTILDHPDLESYVNHFQKSCERLVTLDLLDVSKWHPKMFVMGVKEKYPIWAERQRSNIRTNHDITLASLISDLTDEARESSHERNTKLAMSAQEKSKGKFHAHINSGIKGRFQHCKCCGNPQKRSQLDLKGGSSDDDELSSFVGMATTDSTLICSSNSTILPVSLESAFISLTESFRWVIDTGADRHICKDLDTFDTYLPSNSL
ncbi:hypothetical protein EPUL_005638, partial [Erysiphe pulchra]